MIVVSDTSAITALIQIDRVELLFEIAPLHPTIPSLSTTRPIRSNTNAFISPGYQNQ
jgi:hypothetical protein